MLIIIICLVIIALIILLASRKQENLMVNDDNFLYDFNKAISKDLTVESDIEEIDKHYNTERYKFNTTSNDSDQKIDRLNEYLKNRGEITKPIAMHDLFLKFAK
jgi:FtsZ-interacting cell division protein ZipA